MQFEDYCILGLLMGSIYLGNYCLSWPVQNSKLIGNDCPVLLEVGKNCELMIKVSDSEMLEGLVRVYGFGFQGFRILD